MTAASERVVTTRGEDETIALGARLGRLLRPGDFVALHGELGAGKTRLVRGIARGMGLDPSGVTSPTFVVVNVYQSRSARGGSSCPLVHLDAYRLTGSDDLPALGWDRLMDGTSVVVAEWAERIGDPGLGSDRCFDVTIEHAGPEERRLRIRSPRGRELD